MCVYSSPYVWLKYTYHEKACVAVTVKTVKSVRYLHFSCHDRGRDGIRHHNCGAESRPESRRNVLLDEVDRRQDKLRALGGSR